MKQKFRDPNSSFFQILVTQFTTSKFLGLFLVCLPLFDTTLCPSPPSYSLLVKIYRQKFLTLETLHQKFEAGNRAKNDLHPQKQYFSSARIPANENFFVFVFFIEIFQFLFFTLRFQHNFLCNAFDDIYFSYVLPLFWIDIVYHNCNHNMILILLHCSICIDF